MIINADFIRKYRPIAQNIDSERIEVYIRETESLDIAPVIGDRIFSKLSDLGPIVIDKASVELKDDTGANIFVGFEGELPADLWKLLNGGTYDDKCGEPVRFEGLRVAEAYLAYARFVRNHSINITPFGVVQKVGDDSTAVSNATIASIALDAERIGKEYLSRTVRYWKHIHEDSKVRTQNIPRFVPIGKH